MTASFLKRIGIFALTFFFCFCGIYSWKLSNVKVYSVQTSFYYLVADDLRIEASAEFVKLEGGAGYLFEYNGRDYVALNVYTNKTDCEQVYEHLCGQGKPTLLKEIAIEKLYFLKQEDKRKSEIYLSAFKCLQGDIGLLEGCGNLLEKGETQERCKEILKTLQNQMEFQGERYEDKYKAFSQTCKRTAKKIERLLNSVLYVQDVRYLLCETVDEYMNLAAAFKIK